MRGLSHIEPVAAIVAGVLVLVMPASPQLRRRCLPHRHRYPGTHEPLTSRAPVAPKAPRPASQVQTRSAGTIRSL
jgi:hypothetical protein